MRLVVCDADPDFAHAVALTARDGEHAVRTTTSWFDVLPLIGEFNPHLVFLDLDVPGINAAELSVTVRWLSEARVVLYAARPLPNPLRSELKEKCDSVLAKHRVFYAVRRLPRVGDTRILRRASSDRLRANVAGRFDGEAPLTEVLSGIEFNRKSGVLVVSDERGEEGRLWFREGAPVRCHHGRRSGAAAVASILALTRGEFVLQTCPVQGDREIAETLSKLMFEHLRRQDERNAASA